MESHNPPTKTSKYKEVESLWITFNSTVFPQKQFCKLQ